MVIAWLLKARWYTTDLQHAESSPCQWKTNENGKGYTLSVLGAINAIATWLGICLGGSHLVGYRKKGTSEGLKRLEGLASPRNFLDMKFP